MTTIHPLQARRNGLLAWWREGTPEGRRALIAAALGWMLDSFDVMLYAIVLASLIEDPGLNLSRSLAGALGSVTLLAAGRSSPATGRISAPDEALAGCPVEGTR